MRPITQRLDRDYALDLVTFQAEFAGINTADPVQLKKWFTEHSYLTAHDQARIAKVAVSTIYAWRARVGMPRRAITMARPPKPVRPPDPVAPPNWRDPTW